MTPPNQDDRAGLSIEQFLPIVKKQARLLSGYDYFTREDLTQEGIIAALIAVKSYNPERGALPAYVAVCARNRMISYLRRRRKESLLTEDVMERAVSEAHVSPESDGPHERLELRDSLSSLVKKLSNFEQSVLLAYLREGGITETAAALHCSRKRADNALQRIRYKARNS